MLWKGVQIRYKHAWVQLYTGERRSDFAGRREAPGKCFLKSSCLVVNDPYETVSGWSEVPPLHLCTGSGKGRCCQPPLLKYATWTPQHDWHREQMKGKRTRTHPAVLQLPRAAIELQVIKLTADPQTSSAIPLTRERNSYQEVSFFTPCPYTLYYLEPILSAFLLIHFSLCFQK